MTAPAATGLSLADLERAKLQEEVSPALGGTAITVTHTADNTVTSASEIVLAANASRKEAYIQNVSATGNARIRLDGGTVTTTNGLQLGPGLLMVLEGDDIPTGDITAIREGSSDVVIAVVEFT